MGYYHVTVDRLRSNWTGRGKLGKTKINSLWPWELKPHRDVGVVERIDNCEEEFTCLSADLPLYSALINAGARLSPGEVKQRVLPCCSAGDSLGHPQILTSRSCACSVYFCVFTWPADKTVGLPRTCVHNSDCRTAPIVHHLVRLRSRQGWSYLSALCKVVLN